MIASIMSPTIHTRFLLNLFIRLMNSLFFRFTSFTIFFPSEINALNLSIFRNLFLFCLKSLWYMFLYFCILWNIDNLTKFEYIITINIFKRSMLFFWFRNWPFLIIHWYRILITMSFNELFVFILVIKHVVNEFNSESMHIIQSELFNSRSSFFEILTLITCISIDICFFLSTTHWHDRPMNLQFIFLVLLFRFHFINILSLWYHFCVSF